MRVFAGGHHRLQYRHFKYYVKNLFYLNPLKGRGNYIATSNNMKLVHWPLMGGLLH